MNTDFHGFLSYESKILFLSVFHPRQSVADGLLLRFVSC